MKIYSLKRKFKTKIKQFKTKEENKDIKINKTTARDIV